MKPRPFSNHEKSMIVTGVLSVVLILVVMQLWLLTATMNAFLAGDNGVVWPAAFASLACLCLNCGLLWYLYGLDR